jgi:PAS domain S-box-containing protein
LYEKHPEMSGARAETKILPAVPPAAVMAPADGALLGLLPPGTGGAKNEAAQPEWRVPMPNPLGQSERDTRFEATVLGQMNEAVILLDADDRFVYLNPAAERQYGVPAADALGSPRSTVYDRRWPDARGQALAHEALERSGLWRGELVHVRRDGTALNVESAVTALKDATGRRVGTLSVIRDISERRRYEAELAAAKDDLARQVAGLTRLHELALRLGSLHELQPMLEAILEAAVEIHGTDRGLISLYEPASGLLCVRASRRMDASALERVGAIKPGRETGATGTAFHLRRRIVIEDTEVDPCYEPFREGARKTGFRAVHSTPIVQRSGQILGVLSVHFDAPRRPSARDIQLADMCARYAADAIESARNDAALRETAERMRIAQQAAQWGVFDYNFATGTNYWTPEMEAIYGVQPGELEGTLAGWRKHVHPDDLARTREAYQRALVTGEYNQDYRIIRPDGTVRWLFSRAKFFFDAAGRPQRALGVNVDITHRKQAEEALQEADRRKDEFLATLAHELRNPLAPLRNGLEILRRSGADAATSERVLGVMERQLKHMVRLIDDLLDLARVSRGTIGLRRERIELATALRNAIETSRPLIEAAGHELSTRIPLEPIFVHADLTRLAQVFSNLLNNAAKYTPAGGRIAVAAERRGAETVVTVGDNGMGIPARSLPYVFDMFEQADRSLERRHGGLGIGLTLVRRLLQLHGGTVEANSDGEGRGSEFIVRLPVLAESPQESRRLVAHEERAVFGQRLRILVADDNADAASTLASVLELFGHEVRVANDGLRAVACASEMQPDIVLLDIGMPEMNGYDACRRIREQAWAKDALLIALTGWGQEDHKRRAQEAGFDHHLIKPVDPGALQKLLGSRVSAAGTSGAPLNRPAR